MPGQHGQTYDPDEEPTPRGGWFAWVDRPHPERLERAFRWLANLSGAATGLLGTWVVFNYAQRPPEGVKDYVLAGLLILTAAAMVYGFVRGVGMIVAGLYSMVRDGPEIVVDWRALWHDLPLRRTRVLLIEGALLVCALAGAFWGFALFMRDGSGYGLAMFALINAMIWWPSARRMIQGGGR